MTQNLTPAPHFLFLARHSNDIDHAVPVIWGLLRRGVAPERIRYVVLIPDPSIDPAGDPRLRFLAEQGIRLEEPHFRPLFRRILRRLAEIAPGRVLRRKLRKMLYRDVLRDACNAEDVLQIVTGAAGPLVIVSDHNDHPALKAIREIAAPRGFPMVALPHGFQLHRGFSDLETDAKLGQTAQTNGEAAVFDHILACTPPVGAAADANTATQVHALGTPRFAPEWMEVLSKIYSVPSGKGDKLRVLFLVEKSGLYVDGHLWEWIDTEQQFAALRFLAEHPGIELRIKGNARGITGRQAKLLRPYRRALADDACPTNPLITWADLVVGCCSSVVMDAYVRNKPVLLLEYATRLKMVFKEFGFLENPGSHARFAELVNKLIERRGENLYDPALLQRLIRHYVYAGKEPHSVVDAYAEFLMSLAN